MYHTWRCYSLIQQWRWFCGLRFVDYYHGRACCFPALACSLVGSLGYFAVLDELMVAVFFSLLCPFVEVVPLRLLESDRLLCTKGSTVDSAQRAISSNLIFWQRAGALLRLFVGWPAVYHLLR